MEYFLSQKRNLILKRWVKLVLETYPADTASFLKQERDRFVNPVGYTLAQELETIYQELLHEMEPEKLTHSLTNILKIRSVQDFLPSQATGFILLLKKAIRDELAAEIEKNRFTKELLEFESRIDQLTLLAFDVYERCREEIYEIKLKQVRGEREMTFKLLERASKAFESQNEIPKENRA